MCAGDRGAGTRHQPGEPPEQRGIRSARPKHRQVGRHLLIERDEFVDLGSVEPVAATGQLVETIPAVAMGEHECVDVHRTEVSGRPAVRSAGSVRTMPDVVTGDAVVLDVRIAQLPVRAVGAVIDIAVIGVGYLVALMLWAGTLGRFDDAAVAAIMVIFTVLVFVGYPLVLETTTRGRTVGKLVLGLRVVSDDGSPERFRQALFRALASVVEIWMLLGSPAVLSSMLSPRAQRLGDIFAGTVVINERAPRMAPPPAMPLPLAWWAASLHLAGLDPRQAEAARQFLARATQLDPAVRDLMAYQLAGAIAQQISPPPPPGAPPEYVLAAVVAERHRRAVLNAPRYQAFIARR